MSTVRPSTPRTASRVADPGILVESRSFKSSDPDYLKSSDLDVNFRRLGSGSKIQYPFYKRSIFSICIDKKVMIYLTIFIIK